MAYSLPELVLVGAAQNLVLATSPIESKTSVCFGDGVRDLDPDDQYNEEATW